MPEQQQPSLIQWFDRILTWVSVIFGGGALIFMTVLSVWNVLIMRKALNNPILGAEDVLILVLVVIVGLSIPLGARSGAHIEIEVLESRMSERFAKWSLVLMKVLGVWLLVTMAEKLWEAGGKAVKFGETTQQLLISYEPYYYLLAFSAGVYAFVLCLDIWQILSGRKVVNLKLSGEAL